MPFMVNDFKCLDCSHEFEEVWSKPMGFEEKDPWKGQVECPSCNGNSLTKTLAAPGIAEFSIKDRAGQAASLKQRSLVHSKKLMRQDMDKHRHTISKKMKAITG